MSDLSIIPLEDGFETQLAQDWNGAVGTVYVLDTPSYTPTTTNTYIVVNPGKTNMQIAEITDYDSTANTLTVSNVTLLKGLGINSTAPASSHATGSKVIISDNYQFWVDIQTAINSKLDDTGGTMTGLLQFSGTTHAGIKLLSLTTVQRDALSASNGMLIYNSTTGELNQYIGGAWSAVAAGSTQPTASTTVLGKIKTDVAPAGDPVALITDNPKYDALAGTSGTPSGSNKYVTNDDTASTSSASKLVRANASGKIDSTFINGLASNFTLNENMTVGDVAWVDADGEINTWDGYKNAGNTFYAGSVTRAKTIMVDTNTVVCMYYRATSSYVVAGTIATDVITWGTPVAVSSNTNAFDICKVNTNAGCIIQLGGSSFDGFPFTVSGNTITLGSPVTINGSTSNTGAQSPAITQISTNKVAFVYSSGASQSRQNMRIGTISSNALSLGTESIELYGGWSTLYGAVAKFDTDKCIAVGIDTGSTTLHYQSFTISGTTISAVGGGSGTITGLVSSSPVSLMEVSTNLILLAYNKASQANVRYVSFSANVPTLQTEYTISTTVFTNVTEARKFGCIYNDNLFIFTLGTGANQTIYVERNDSTYYLKVSETIPTGTAGMDTGICQYTTGKIIIPVAQNPGVGYIFNNGARAIVGILQETGTVGQTKSVSINGGISSGHSGLSIGEPYYAKSDGTIGTGSQSYFTEGGLSIKKIGDAMSATEILINIT